MKSKLIKAIVTCVVVVGVGFGGYYGYNTYFATKKASAAAQYYNVSTQKMNLQVSVQGTGAAYASITKDVSPNNNGTLKNLNVKIGDTVKSGQTLFVSDSDDVRRSVTTAKNNLTKQNLTLSSDENAEKVDTNKIATDKLSVSDAESQLNDAYAQLNKMTVTAPIGGVITAVNNSNGDSAQSGTSVLTVVDMNSIKIKVSVDELDIGKINVGQKADIKFDAIKDKTYEGLVETIAQIGTTSNNVTTYDVVVAVKDPAGIKLGMNANVIIAVESKENALVIPVEALVESNGQKYVRVENTGSTTSENKDQSNASNSQGQALSGQTNKQASNNRNNGAQSSANNSKLVAIKTGLETDNYIEITEGITEGQKVLVQLPRTSSTTNNNNKNSLGGFGGNMGGGLGGSMGGPGGQGGGNNSGSKN